CAHGRPRRAPRCRSRGRGAPARGRPVERGRRAVTLTLIAIGSLLVHEWAHGLTAAALGDPIPRLLCRHWPDPFAHLHPVGSILLPIAMAAFGLPPIGWGRPLPFSAALLGRRRSLLVLAAG